MLQKRNFCKWTHFYWTFRWLFRLGRLRPCITPFALSFFSNKAPLFLLMYYVVAHKWCHTILDNFWVSQKSSQNLWPPLLLNRDVINGRPDKQIICLIRVLYANIDIDVFWFKFCLETENKINIGFFSLT